jgi:glutaredoxin-related protein
MCPSAGSQKQATVYSSINSLLILLCLCSNWPTFPQIFIKGEFVGGSDIILDMHQKGQLKDVLGDIAQKREQNESS